MCILGEILLQKVQYCLKRYRNHILRNNLNYFTPRDNLYILIEETYTSCDTSLNLVNINV